MIGKEVNFEKYVLFAMKIFHTFTTTIRSVQKWHQNHDSRVLKKIQHFDALILLLNMVHNS